MSFQEDYNTIFELHYPKVLRLCKGYCNGDLDEASDLAQEVFIKVWEHLNGFKNQCSISTWVYRITVNSCLMYLRKKKKTKKIP